MAQSATCGLGVYQPHNPGEIPPCKCVETHFGKSEGTWDDVCVTAASGGHVS